MHASASNQPRESASMSSVSSGEARLVKVTVVQAAPVLFDRERTLDFDVVGHYARPDVFKLSVDERPSRSITRESDSR